MKSLFFIVLSMGLILTATNSPLNLALNLKLTEKNSKPESLPVFSSCFNWGSDSIINGDILSNGEVNFVLNGYYQLRMVITTYQLGSGLGKAHGYVTNFYGDPSAYSVAEDPTAPASKIRISYSICSVPYGVNGCTSACCSSSSCSTDFVAYLYKTGSSANGTLQFIISKNPLEIPTEM